MSRGAIKKLNDGGVFLILVGSILLLSAEKAYQKINCLWPKVEKKTCGDFVCILLILSTS